MATEEKTTPEQLAASQDAVCFAELPGSLAIVKVQGRGTFTNSVELKRLAEDLSSREPQLRIIIDLENCATMDSTFMGVLASVGLRQKRETGEKMTIVNANAQNVRLLQTLGLSHFMNVRTTRAGTPEVEAPEFQYPESGDISRHDRIVHMIEAHQTLCDADNKNELRFQSVLKYLSDSLNREENPTS